MMKRIIDKIMRIICNVMLIINIRVMTMMTKLKSSWAAIVRI